MNSVKSNVREKNEEQIYKPHRSSFFPQKVIVMSIEMHNTVNVLFILPQENINSAV